MSARVSEKFSMAVMAAAVVALAAPACQAASPHIAPAVIPVEALRQDFALLRSAITEGAAALYRHHTREEIEADFDAAQARVTGPMTPVAFWRVVAPVVATADDGHMFAYLNSSLSVQAQEGWRFPLRFQIIDERLYVVRNYSHQAIPTGSEIISINNHDARSLIDNCGAFFAADGGLQSRKLRKIEKEFSSTCVPALDLGPEFSVVIRPRGVTADMAPIVHVLPGLTGEQWQEAVQRIGGMSQQGEAAFDLKIWSDRRTALLTLGAFARSNTFDPAARFAEAFAQIKAQDVTDLILDMRGSSGGRDADGALLYAHMTPEPFRYVQERILNKASFEFLEATPSRALNQALAGIPHRQGENGRIVLNDRIDQLQQPQPDAFGGRIYLIVDGNTFSTGSEFASIFQNNRRGVVIGQETGTAYEGGSGGSVSLQLPNSGVMVDIPLVAYVMAVDARPDSRGVVPDILVPPTVEALVLDEDPALAEAVALIEAAQAGEAR